jgi:uncharacterized Tic20 family protein
MEAQLYAGAVRIVGCKKHEAGGEMQEAEAVQGVAEGEMARAPTDEWTAAALAHASILLTVILSAAGGIGVFIGPAIPLVMYFGYKDRSRFVAFHAMQAFVYQLASVAAYIALVAALAVWLTLTWVAVILLSFVLLGLLLIPFALLFTLLVVFILLCIPFAWIGYGLYASYQVYQGRNLHYWLIGDWLAKEVRA